MNHETHEKTNGMDRMCRKKSSFFMCLFHPAHRVEFCFYFKSVVLILCAFAGLAAGLPPALARQLDAELAAVVATPGQELASLSVLAVRKGQVVYHRSFGHKWIDPVDPGRSLPADDRTLYRVASISKLVTTLGVMRLVEQGKLDLDRDVGTYLGWRFRNPHFPDVPITLRMLLSHTSSLRDDAGYYQHTRSDLHLRDFFTPGGRLHGDGRMWARNAAPGRWFQYANLPWGVVAMVMEKAAGERFDRLLRRLLLDPMGLPGGFHPADFSRAERDDLATLYRKRREVDGKEVWDPQGPWIAQTDPRTAEPPAPRAGPDYELGSNGLLFGPQGGCRLSVAGLGEILRMLLDGGVHRGRRILKTASVDRMLSTQWRADGREANGNRNGESGFGTAKRLMNAWGLGVQHFLDLTGPGSGDRLVEPGGFKASGHLGDAYGLTAVLAFDRISRNGLVFVVGGIASDPERTPGSYSGHFRHEERILTTLYRRAILQDDGKGPAPLRPRRHP